MPYPFRVPEGADVEALVVEVGRHRVLKHHLEEKEELILLKVLLNYRPS